MKILKSNHIMYKWLKVPRFMRFLVIGCVNAGIAYVIYAICVLLLGDEHYKLCATLQWVLSSFTSYFNQKFFVFCTRGNYIKEYIKCCSTWAVSYVLNIILLEIFVRFMIKNVYVAQFISLFLVSLVTYVLFKFFAFKSTEDKQISN